LALAETLPEFVLVDARLGGAVEFPQTGARTTTWKALEDFSFHAGRELTFVIGWAVFVGEAGNCAERLLVGTDCQAQVDW